MQSTISTISPACRLLSPIIVWASALRHPRANAWARLAKKAAHLKGAVAEAATVCWRNKAAGQRYRARREKKHGQAKAWTLLAHKLARAVYDRLKRKTAFAMDTVLHG
jgi:hypothetical protein